MFPKVIGMINIILKSPSFTLKVFNWFIYLNQCVYFSNSHHEVDLPFVFNICYSLDISKTNFNFNNIG